MYSVFGFWLAVRCVTGVETLESGLIYDLSRHIQSIIMSKGQEEKCKKQRQLFHAFFCLIILCCALLVSLASVLSL